eukprot:TRINITY_DN10155_c0_g1_i3.p1 TRINITY_DN10155_c0_g1~~TRINITY_DN10155_c0_g1_i3.p1  ORF type:complete len:257 (-),score=48.92 TRINITY_DN10155_c0_g1_i3:521-1291(-)
MVNNTVKILRLGVVPYRAAYKLQEHLVATIKQNISQKDNRLNLLLLLQHPPVYTTGIRSKEYSVYEEERLKKLGADFVRTNRGGLITFHGPGQLVAYPILNLNNFIPQAHRRKAGLGMRWYVKTLEEVVIQTISKYGLEGSRSPHTGVWVGDNKICAMGVHNSQLVTSHGLALNANTDMAWFKNIVPCGILDKGVTSLTQQLGREISVEETTPHLVDSFATQFGAEMVECESAQAEAFIPPQLQDEICLANETIDR